MSCSYADGLSPYHDKGKLGLAEHFDDVDDIQKKVKILAEWMRQSKHVVIHTGAGISTSAGIPDFRGPKGVWTLEEKGEKPTMNVSFNEAIPTKTHMAILQLVQAGKVQFVISQNIDGLHLRSGLPRKYLAELHGNMFVEQCRRCQRQFVRDSATTSVGQKCLEKPCPMNKSNGRPCRGKLHDIILDWEHDLPENDLGLADFHSCLADLSICLGTTLQIVPSGTLPLNTKKYNAGKLVICNLQPTKYDKKADLLIHTYVDDIMVQLLKEFNLDLPEFDPRVDPSRLSREALVEWTIPESEVKQMRSLYERTCCKAKKRRQIKEETVEFESKPELKSVIKGDEPTPKISKLLENDSISLNNVKEEPLTSTTDGNQDEIESIGNERTKNSFEVIRCDSYEKANELPYYNHEEDDLVNRVQVFQKQDSSKNSPELNDKPCDTNLNKSAEMMNKEIIFC